MRHADWRMNGDVWTQLQAAAELSNRDNNKTLDERDSSVCE